MAGSGESRLARRDQEFLPAALEVLELPPSPIGRAVVWGIVAFLLLALAWTIFGRIDVVATARGVVTPEGLIKPVEAYEAGRVEAVLVREGDLVTAGQPLVDMDPLEQSADLDRVQDERTASYIDAAVSKTVLAHAGFEYNLAVPPEITSKFGQLIALRSDAVWRRFQSNTAALHEAELQLEAQLDALESETEKIDQVLPLATERLSAQDELLRDGFTTRYLHSEALERKIELEKDRERLDDERRNLEAGLREAGQRKLEAESAFATEHLEALAMAQRSIDATNAEFQKADLRASLQTLRAPVSGVVEELAVSSPGEVVEPAQLIAVIVPVDETMVVDARVLNKDVGFIAPGQTAKVKFDAFADSAFGSLEGQVLRVSEDAVEDEQLGNVYQARIVFEEEAIHAMPPPFRLSPGMQATVDIRTGDRRIIEVILEPLFRWRDDALRER